MLFRVLLKAHGLCYLLMFLRIAQYPVLLQPLRTPLVVAIIPALGINPNSTTKSDVVKPLQLRPSRHGTHSPFNTPGLHGGMDLRLIVGVDGRDGDVR